MRIAYLANSRFPSERAHMTQIVQMCNAFSELGHEVTLCVTDRDTEIEEDPGTYFGVPIHFSPVRFSVPDIAGRAGYIPHPLRPLFFLIQRFMFVLQARSFLKEKQYDLVYGRDEWILFFLSCLIKIPIVWESHEAKFSYAAQSIIRRIKKFVVISEGIAQFYEQHGVDPTCIHIAHDAVDERFFAPRLSQDEARRRLGIETTRPVVMYIGGLDAWKGAEILFVASRDQSIYEVYVIGGKREEIELFHEKYPHIHFLGQRPYRELPQNQQAADVLVIPNTAKNSLSAEYTSPLKLFAHMTSGVPIVASNIPSIIQILDGKNAQLVAPDDPDALNEGIKYVLGHTEQSRLLAFRAQERAKRYTWVERTQGILVFVSGQQSDDDTRSINRPA